MKYQPSLEQYEIIYNNTSNAIFLIGVEGPDQYRVLSVNAIYLKWNGLKPEDIIGKRIEEYYEEAGVQHITRRYREAIDHRGPYRYEVSEDIVGPGQFIQTTLVPVFDENDQCTHIIGVVRNITRAKREAIKLEAEKKRAETYLDIAAALIVALDLDGVITLLNRKGYELLGYEPGTLVGRPWPELLSPPEDIEKNEALFREFIASGGPTGEATTTILASNGDKRRIKMTHTLLFDESGKPSGMLSSGEDVTDIERAQKSLITSQRLLAAEEVVMAAAHDFNNSLQAIMGNIEVALSKAELPDAIAEHLHASINLAEDAGSRIRSLQQSPNKNRPFESVSINQLVNDVVGETRFYWDGVDSDRSTRVSVETKLDEAVGSSQGHAADLRTVLFNIIKNAVEAIENEGTVTITTFQEQNQNIIQVADNGKGMDSDTLTRIFQPFFSTKGYETGRGLGMSSARNIIRAHGGSIQVASTKVGKGSVMEIRLPLEVDAVQPHIPAAMRSERHTILWVDDDPRIQELAQAYIDGLGHEGQVARGGAEALELLQSGEFSLVITDIGMPDMNGQELARIIRQSNSTIPIIALTGWGDDIIDINDESCGINKVIEKPLKLDALKILLSEIPGPRSAA